MKCPRCGFENQENVNYCCQCGLPRNNPQLNVKKEMPPKTEPLNYNIPMNFHVFYSIIMILASAFGLLSSLICLFFEEYVAVSFVAFLPSAVLLTTAILLLMRNKVGNVMRLVFNIYQIVKHSLVLISVLICGIVFAIFTIVFIATAESEAAMIFILLFFVLAFLSIAAIGNIVINALIINYYNKRKHMFN